MPLLSFPVDGDAADAFALLGIFERIEGDHQRGQRGAPRRSSRPSWDSCRPAS